MAPLTFADTHNMIAFLTKSDASEGFDQIIDFLNAHTIQYALMVNPPICVSCIKQFWASILIKKFNDVMQLQALIDRKKIFAELARIGYEKPSTKLTFYKSFFPAQSKFLIHTIVQCMSAKRTALNEFSSFMALAVICLATCRKFNFSKYFFDSMDVVEVEKDEDDNEVSAAPTPPSPTPATTPPPPQQEAIPSPPQAQSTQPSSPSQQQPSHTTGISESSMTLLNKDYHDQAKGQEVREEEKIQNIWFKDVKEGRKIVELDANEDVTLVDVDAKAEPAKIEEVLEVDTTAKLMTEVVTTAAHITTAAQVPKASALRRRRGVVIQDPKEIAAASIIMHSEIVMDEAFARQLEAELNANINWNDVIEQVKRNEKQDNVVMRYQALKRKSLTEAQARKNMMIYLKNIAGFKMDFFRGMTYSEIKRIFKKHYNSIQAFLEKGENEIEEEGSKRKATPLALKVPVVDYQIHHENNKPYYKIIRADGTHKLFLSFITSLKNFDREDLETLWKLVKERFESTEPKNFSDDFLLNILKIMFKKPNVEANIWRDQKGIYGLAKVKS
uniref:Xylulose kinase-1 n=1 Tax=Tanacetum cinerariifolium TaxID=118510 RepID=A0A6L2J6C1_TANCI|nr:hypothetical protein [Tanacetum cinerariifolium]